MEILNRIRYFYTKRFHRKKIRKLLEGSIDITFGAIDTGARSLFFNSQHNTTLAHRTDGPLFTIKTRRLAADNPAPIALSVFALTCVCSAVCAG